MKHSCPVCGDPNAFPIWIDKEPPAGCPQDWSWHDGSPREIDAVTECKYQMGKAWQQAEFRKLVPDAFDEMGKMKPGRIAEVLGVFQKTHPNKAIVI